VDSPEQLQDITSRIDDANANGATGVEFEGREFDLSDQEKVARTLDKIKQKVESRAGKSTVDEADQEEPDLNRGTESAVVAIDSNDEVEDFVRAAQLNGFDKNGQQFSLDTVKRTPFPHQQEGIQWLLAHYENAMSIPGGSGALLADDMGLGKTYMILVSIAEWYRRVKAQNKPQKPVLIVAPLSLIENWQAEVEQTFHKSPFTDIVVLQSGADLKKFRIAGGKKETQQDFKESDIIEDQDEIRYSLKVGGVYGIDRLDTAGRLVLTTYQTLRDYQFSLSRIDWSIVAFDEAQNLKNPNTLATRAAKAVKSDVKILATGTPVENSLKDFWCLMDTAVPGLLGAWQTFRSKYIEPITSATEDTVRSIKADVGRSLREAVGEYMLRRTKEEKLDGLPEKRIFSGDADVQNATYLPDLAALMRGAQLNHYDDIINAIRHSTTEDKRKLVLPGLLKMKLTSIHQDIERKMPLPHSLKELERQALSSAKITAMMSLLKSIQQRREKVLIFATSKAVQAYVCALVSSVFKIKIDIINGETQAVATGRNLATRKGIIDEFQKGEGFGVIVMSPIAAGVGLTVTGANNVIHLERHWNPAKEAQATDRVYRIGQKRNVNVYIPIALHPKIRSFDLQLDSLLSNKVDLSDAVVAASQVEASDLMGCFSD
jgi:SNF2 family DNA or RNA helicase